MTVFKDDIGTLIKLDTKETVTGATSVAIKYRKPDGTVGSWSSTAATQYVQYTTQAGDLDVAGTWTVQAYVSGLSGWTGHGGLASFAVVAPIST